MLSNVMRKRQGKHRSDEFPYPIISKHVFPHEYNFLCQYYSIVTVMYVKLENYDSLRDRSAIISIH